MDQQGSAERQIGLEQETVDEMYRRLDDEVRAKVAERERVESAPVDETGDRYAKGVELSRLSDRIRRLRGAENGLCFGRIDGDDGALHIGRIGLRDDADELLLIDWRAEAARPFYAATPIAPMGVRRRRHLRLDGRSVTGVTDEILDGTAPTDDDLVGDGPLVAALSVARTGRMHEAAATLQTEQDQIVRSAHRGVMVVDGGPGTGKTIVALHRAAYVLYAFEAIADRGVLVYGPNQRFLDYISGVLPSLGENDVALATAGSLTGIDVTVDDPEDVARRKGRADMAAGLADWVDRRRPHGRPLTIETVDDTVTLPPAAVDAARRHALQGDVGHNRARELFLEYVVDDVVTELEESSAADQAAFEDEVGIDFDRIAGISPGDHADGLDIDWDAVREQLLDDPIVDRAVSRVWPPLRADDVVRRFVVEHDDLPDAGDGWTVADLALLDEARALVDGPPDITYGHIVVDEAQQLSEMAWRMLMRRCPNRSMTIVGDLAQAGPTTTVESWAAALGPFVGDRFEHHRLTVNYRTTAEILDSTAPLLAVIAPDQTVAQSIRHGDEPRTVTAGEQDLVAAVSSVLDETARAHPGELIGVVAAAGRLASIEPFLTGAEFVAAPDARGLEFDTVVIVDPDGIAATGNAGLRDLYVAQTRATKRLVSVAVG
ncbi:MAG: AAA family ATPase [Gordonia sp. (in: high G+C Gram-positive bacteria)]|uniref:HelD family protein n=1 Tax=Gordonia sp. (in: high G+C Gram-positive bacteria) TaxID=84139 RepID=UPI0039E30457